MCWMPFAAKNKSVCFDCRKTFVSYRYGAAAIPCPQCGATMWNAGVHFRSPKRNDLRQWVKVRVLAAHGFRFANAACCGWYGPGPRPRTLGEVPPFVAGQKEVSQDSVVAQVRAARKAYR
jgi:predicted RNA-binding Zn-ribbon protein involved in translation (DUF1610 family)